MRRRLWIPVAAISLVAFGAHTMLPTGCTSRSGDSDSRERVEAFVLDEGTAVVAIAGEALVKVPALGAVLALYTPDTQTTGDPDSVHALPSPTENRSGISGVIVAGPSDGAFTITLGAGNTLIHEFEGSIVVTFVDDQDAAVDDPTEAATIAAIDIDVDLDGPGGITVNGEIVVELDAPGVPIDPATDTVTVNAELAIALSAEGADVDGGHGGHNDEGDGHGAGETGGGEALIGVIDFEVEGAVFGFIASDPVDFVEPYYADAQAGQTGIAEFAFSLELALGTRSEGGHLHGDGPAPLQIPVSIEFDLAEFEIENDGDEEHVGQLGELQGGGVTATIEIDLEPIEAPVE